jgi:hypothetical protein
MIFEFDILIDAFSFINITNEANIIFIIFICHGELSHFAEGVGDQSQKDIRENHIDEEKEKHAKKKLSQIMSVIIFETDQIQIECTAGAHPEIEKVQNTLNRG